MHVIAAKAVAFGEALRPSFQQYAGQVVTNAQVLSETLVKGGCNACLSIYFSLSPSVALSLSLSVCVCV